MGCGKTTIGSDLSQYLNKPSVDLDSYIEHITNMKISDIFGQHGEGYFRQVEESSLKAVLSGESEIICTGGGIIYATSSQNLLKANKTFYLKYNFDTLYNRIKGDKTRPLATSYEELKRKYESRINKYEECASYIVDCEDKTREQIVEEIANYLTGF